MQLGSGSMYDRKETGLRIKEYRKLANRTQEKLAFELKISRSKISSWETGGRDICMTDAIQLCDYFNVSLDTIFCPKEIGSKELSVIIGKYFENKKISKKEKDKTLRNLLKKL